MHPDYLDNKSNKTASSDYGILLPEKSFKNSLLPIIIGATAISLARIPGAFNESLSIRNRVPEPFDVPDHIGNFILTFGFIAHFVHSASVDKPTAIELETYKKKRKLVAIVAGTISIAANIYAEKIGYGSFSTQDPLDFAYGLMGGALAYYSAQEKYISGEEVDEMMNEKEMISESFVENATNDKKNITYKTAKTQKIIKKKRKIQKQSRKLNR